MREDFFKFILPTSLLFFLQVFTGCAVKKPESPSWDIKVILPLMNETYRIPKIAGDEEYLSILRDSLFFSLRDTLTGFRVGDNLTIAPTAKAYHKKLGPVKIRGAQANTEDVKLTEVNSSLGQFQEESTPIGSFTFPSLEKKARFSTFDYVTVDSGYLRIKLINHFPFPLKDMVISIVDSVSGVRVGELSFAGLIDPGEEAVDSLDLTGKTIYSIQVLGLSGRTPGTNGNSVYIDTLTQIIDLVVSISTLKASEALAQIPPQTITKVDSIEVESENLIQEAVIKEGSVHFYLYNELDLSGQATLTLLDFSREGSPFSPSWHIPADGSISDDIPLDGYTFRPLSFTRPQFIRFRVVVETEDTGDKKVGVSSSQEIRGDVESSQIVLYRFAGALEPTRIRTEPEELLIDLPEGLKAISLSTARMNLVVRNGVGFPLELDSLSLQGYDQGGSSLEELTIPPGQEYIPPEAETIIKFNEDNSNILPFVNALPRRIKTWGSILVGDGIYQGDAQSSDTVLISYHIFSPLELSIEPQTIEGGTTMVEIGEDTREFVEDNLQSGAIIAQVINHLPLGASVTFYFDPDSTNLDSGASLIIPTPPDSLDLKPGHTDESGIVDRAVESSSSIHLSHQDLLTFRNPLLFLRTRVEIPGTQGKSIKICPEDYLKITARLEVGAKVGED